MVAAQPIQKIVNDLRIREKTAGDVAFICSKWKRTFWDTSFWAAGMRWQTFLKGHSPIIDDLVAKSTVLIACDPAAPESDQILGFLVFELEPQQLVHYAYTKPAFEKMGIATTLLTVSGLPADLRGVTVSHVTRAWFPDNKTNRKGLKSRYPEAIHDPYAWIHRYSTAASPR